MGADGFTLLDALEARGALAGGKDLPAIEILRRVWQRHFECTPDGKPPAGGVHLRADRELARAAEPLESPYETNSALPNQALDELGRLHGPLQRDL